MAKGGKARTVIVRMISTAQTGFFYTTKRVRLNSPKLSAVKYDPVGAQSESSFRRESEDKEMMQSLRGVQFCEHFIQRSVYALDECILFYPDTESDQRYALELNRTHLLFVPPLHPNTLSGTVVQVCLRGELGEGNISDVFPVEQASITKTIETLVVGHVNALDELPERVIVEGIPRGYMLIGVRKPWRYGRGKQFCLGGRPLQPAEHKWIFRFGPAK